MRAPSRRVQCKACPWRKDVEAAQDIPGGYCEKKHRDLSSTISDGGFDPGALRMMACHESKPGAEFVCVGWLANQLGPGNNIALRLRVAMGVPAVSMPFKLVGPQHESFEDTLGETLGDPS